MGPRRWKSWILQRGGDPGRVASARLRSTSRGSTKVQANCLRDFVHQFLGEVERDFARSAVPPTGQHATTQKRVHVQFREEIAEANVHLLAALGSHETPFVPVEIRKAYDGYSWARVGRIENVEVQIGKILHEDSVWSEWLVCVESIRISVRTDDGSAFASPVCMALVPVEEQNQWSSNYKVCVTLEARERLMASEIWHHLGGWCEDGDTYDTQAEQFEQELDRFWRDMVGPDEHLRAALLDATCRITREWQSVNITSTGTVDIQFADGTTKSIQTRPATPS